MAASRGFVGVCLAALAGCAHGVRENPMIARAAADLSCDAGSVRWQALDDQHWIARGCERQVQYATRCHDEFENPARPAYPPIEVCEWHLEGGRPGIPPASGSPGTNPPR